MLVREKKELGSPMVAMLQAISSSSSNAGCTAKYPRDVPRDQSKHLK